MNSDRQTDREIYRLIITRRTAAETLVERDGSGWRLPRLEVATRRRIAEQLTAGTKQAWQLVTCCLFLPRIAAATENQFSNHYVLMEATGDTDSLPVGMSWVPASVATGKATLQENDRAAIARSIEEMDRYEVDPATGPFARPGWLAELFAWIQDVVSPLGLRLTGGFRQLNASPTFSLVRIETNRVALWFKAAGAPNAQEMPVTVALARLFPGYLPEILGVHARWNGWLAREAPGATLDGLTEISAWTRAARALAELQIASISKSRELLECGCQDLRLSRLIGEIDPFLRRASELMALQTRQPPPALTDEELELLGGELKAACLVLQDTGVRETLGHIDFNPGNILVSPDVCRFVDWAEACVTHPLVTFEYLAEHSRHQDIEDTAARARIADAYLEPWSALFSPDELTGALSRSPLVAVFAYAVGARGLRSPEFLKNPTIARYFRSLSRRMYREAVQLRQRSEPCHA